MRLDITGRNVDITQPLRQLITQRLARIERLLNDSAVSATVVLTIEKYRHRSEIVVHARGDHMLRGLGEGTDWRMSLRQAAEKVEQQAKKVKSKWKERKRSGEARRVPRGAGGGPNARPVRGELRAETADSSALRVVRARRYPVKPMTIEDAALRVEETTETFVVFRNAESDAISILYRRKDGRLGLIEPD